jgi:hypothetical protein
MKKLLLYCLCFILISNQFAIGQEETTFVKNPILTSKLMLGVGMYIPTQKVKLSVDGSSNNNDINFKETFDFSNSGVRPEVSFDWRFSKKWKLSAEYFNANYTKKMELEEDIEIGDSDYTFESGSNVKLGYKINLYRIYVGRVISSGLKHELGGGLGFHLLNIGPFIEGTAIVSTGNGDEYTEEFKRAETTLTAPLPNIALWYYFAPTEKWAFTARLDWLALTVNEYSGSLWDVGPSVRYQVIKNLGISLDYRYFIINASVNKDVWNGSLDLSFSGPTLTLIGNL